jgi:hypothetical protein
MSLITIAGLISERFSLDTGLSETERIAGIVLALTAESEPPKSLCASKTSIPTPPTNDAICWLVAKAMLIQHDHDALARVLQEQNDEENEEED